MRKHFPLLLFLVARTLQASGHGPVFAMATPTNPAGGWSFDTSIMGRAGSGRAGQMARFTLGYGLTPDIKVSFSAPAIFKQEPFLPARTSAFTPMGGDFEALGLWRFHRQNAGVGSRLETTLVGGALFDGPQGVGGNGGYLGLVSGYASRSHYVWAGAGYQKYVLRRPDVFNWSGTYAWRPKSWRTDYPRWDWRIFGELVSCHS